MNALLADTSYLAGSPYGLWGIIMVVVLLGLVCYNAWEDDAEARRRGYYVLAAALVLGVLILLTLHFWQVEPAELLRIVYQKPGFLHRHARYNVLFFTLLGWIAASWGLGSAVYKALHRRQDEDE
ncbi:MAG: hypothetical protein E7032_02685 [Akkermansiaceae bacterium]|nr:hypothetical protein [Akkermansiaceae bacterium]